MIITTMHQVACNQGITTLITLSTCFIGTDLTRPCSEHLPSVPTTVASSVIYYVPAADLCGPACLLDLYYKYSETINRGTQNVPQKASRYSGRQVVRPCGLPCNDYTSLWAKTHKCVLITVDWPKGLLCTQNDTLLRGDVSFLFRPTLIYGSVQTIISK
jgi:hypothetical protein